jgi:hypothetical protein
LWKTPVGEHNGHDNDSVLALSHKLHVTYPYTALPGSLGGVLSNMAVADGSVYVATIDLPITFTAPDVVDGDKAAGSETGEVEALNLATGKVEWDTKVSSMPLGATTVSNDLVFTTLYRRVLIALNRDTGAIVYRRQLPTSTNAPIAVSTTRCWCRRAGPRRRPRVFAAMPNSWPTPSPNWHAYPTPPTPDVGRAIGLLPASDIRHRSAPKLVAAVVGGDARQVSIRLVPNRLELRRTAMAISQTARSGSRAPVWEASTRPDVTRGPTNSSTPACHIASLPDPGSGPVSSRTNTGRKRSRRCEGADN